MKTRNDSLKSIDNEAAEQNDTDVIKMPSYNAQPAMEKQGAWPIKDHKL